MRSIKRYLFYIALPLACFGALFFGCNSLAADQIQFQESQLIAKGGHHGGHHGHHGGHHHGHHGHHGHHHGHHHHHHGHHHHHHHHGWGGNGGYYGGGTYWNGGGAVWNNNPPAYYDPSYYYVGKPAVPYNTTTVVPPATVNTNVIVPQTHSVVPVHTAP